MIWHFGPIPREQFMFDREEAERQEAALFDADDSETARRIHLAAPKVEIDIVSDRSTNSTPESKKKAEKKKSLFRRKTIDVIDKSLLLVAMFGRSFKKTKNSLRKIGSSPALFGSSFYARPPTPVDPKLEFLKEIVYPAKPVEKRFGRLNSFNIQAAEQFVKKLKRRLSEPNLKKLKKLTKSNLELLKMFDTGKLLNRHAFKAPNASPCERLTRRRTPKEKMRRRLTKRLSTFNLGLLFGTENSPTYSQQTTPVESCYVTMTSDAPVPVQEKQRKVKKIHRKTSTFNLGLLFGSKTSPTYSQETSPKETLLISDSEDDTLSAASFKSESPSSEILNDGAAAIKRAMDIRREQAKIESAKKSEQKTLKVLNDWNKQARMIAFIRDAPVPMPPKCAYLPLRGVYSLFPKAPPAGGSVDNTSIYHPDSPPQIVKNQKILHKLVQKDRPGDLESPEALPVNLKDAKFASEDQKRALSTRPDLAFEDESYQLISGQATKTNWMPMIKNEQRTELEILHEMINNRRRKRKS